MLIVERRESKQNNSVVVNMLLRFLQGAAPVFFAASLDVVLCHCSWLHCILLFLSRQYSDLGWRSSIVLLFIAPIISCTHMPSEVCKKGVGQLTAPLWENHTYQACQACAPIFISISCCSLLLQRRLGPLC